MPKFHIHTSTDTYFSYVAECVDEEEARQRGRIDFENSLENLVVDVTVEQVDDDTPVGDV